MKTGKQIMNELMNLKVQHNQRKHGNTTEDNVTMKELSQKISTLENQKYKEL